MTERLHQMRASEGALREFLFARNAITGWDVAAGEFQPFLLGRRRGRLYLGVHDWFDRARMVYPPLVDVLRWPAHDPADVSALLGHADWLGAYHLTLARCESSSAVRLASTPWRWLACVTSGVAAVCWIAERPIAAADVRAAFLNVGAVVAEDDDAAELIYRGLRQRERERYPEVRIGAALVDPLERATRTERQRRCEMPLVPGSRRGQGRSVAGAGSAGSLSAAGSAP